jgi:prepilin-type N-terminal cleavage/methylation domain-containing protein
MQSSNKNGFTLIEMLVTIAILAIGLAIAIPNLMEIGRRDQVKTEARQLKDQLALARARAVELNRPEVITLTANSYTVGTTSINLTHTTLSAVTTDADDNDAALTEFQWQERGYPTTVGGAINDIDPITITLTSPTKLCPYL